MASVPMLSACIVMVLCAIASANVIGIDFGSDTMKVAIVQPGTPLEIVTNFQSKRKTPTCITFYRGERMFGSDATALMARKPELTFAKTINILGRTPEHPLSTEFKKQYFPYEIYTNETLGVTSFKQEETYYTPEELVAMILQHAKDMTANFGGKVIRDCVITVPSSFTQHERRALYTAADIADLKVLSLIEENTAAALHYGIDRVFEQPNTVLYFNMGASAVQVTIATYSSYIVKEGGKNKTIGQFEVVGKGWDAALGGFNFDVRLAELLASRFNEVWNKKASGKGKDLKDFFRPMTRLRVEANKVKEVLSANNEFPVKAEQLHDNTDLITKITRADFEDACDDLFARITKPINAALAQAGLQTSDINAVELLGGAVRMPKVKKLLEEYFKESKLELGQHLNGDEAMALGASFRAANLSTAFRVRKVGVSDISTFGVSVRLENLQGGSAPSGGLFGSFLGGNKADKGAASEVWEKHTELYPAKSPVPSKTKTVAFQHDSDILCRLAYNDEVVLPEGSSQLLAEYNITGIADFAKETASKGVGAPKVHLSFALDHSGVVALVKAEATLELPPEPEETVLGEEEKAANATAEAEDSKADEEDDKKEAEGEDKKEAEGEEKKDTEGDKKEAEGEKKKDKKKKDKKPKEVKKPKKDTTLRKTLIISENTRVIVPNSWTPAAIAESKLRLRALAAADDARKAREAALNELETYIYKIKNRLSEDEGNLKKVSTEEQRQEIVDLSNAAEEWLYDDGRNADVSEYKSKQQAIRLKAEAIFTRYSELKGRPEAVKKALAQLEDVRVKAASWAEKLPHITEEEKEKLLETVSKAETWISDKQAAQAAKTAIEEPAFLSGDVPLQLKAVGLAFEKLLRKPKPAPPAPQKNATTSANATAAAGNETSAEAGAAGADEPVKVHVHTEGEVKKEEKEL